MCPTTQRHFRWAQTDPICTDILHTTPTPPHTPYNTQTSYNAPPHAAISLRIPGDPLQHIHISHSAHGSLTTHNLQTSSIKHRLGQRYPRSLHKTQKHAIIQGLDSQSINIPFKIGTPVNSLRNHIATYLSFKAEAWHTNYTVGHNRKPCHAVQILASQLLNLI